MMVKVRRFFQRVLVLAFVAMPNMAVAGVQDVWELVKTRSDLHLGDNVQPAVFYNARKGATNDQRFFGGAVTTVYDYVGPKFQAEIQVGGLKGLGSGDPFIPTVGATIRLEQYLAYGFKWVPPLLGEPANLALFEDLRVGPYFAYDFREKQSFYGGYVSRRFGGVKP